MNFRKKYYGCEAERALCLFCEKLEAEVDSAFKFKINIIRAVDHTLRLEKASSVTYGFIKATRQPLVFQKGVDECVYIKVPYTTRRLLIHTKDYDFYRKEYKRTRGNFLYVRHSLRS